MTEDRTGTDRWQAQEFCALSGTDNENMRLATQMWPIQQGAFYQANPEAKGSAHYPTNVFVGVSRDMRTLWLARLVHIPLDFCHIFWLFEFADGSWVVHEANWRGVRRAEWDAAHKADGWVLFADDRMTPEAVGRAWAFCLGAEGKVYEYTLLVWLALRLVGEAWRRMRGMVGGRGGVAEVCSSLVNSAGEAIFGEPYVNRSDPTPDEIVANEHLRFVEGGEEGWAAP